MLVPVLPSALQTSILVWSLVTHVVADWLLQTDWMAQHKTKLRHPASWVHSGIHVVCLLWLLPWYLALLVGVAHLLIDTRIPIYWWMRVVKGMRAESQQFKELVIWMDQVFHITTLAIVVLLFL